VLDEPGVDTRLLAAEVAAAWAIEVTALVFLPAGLDGRAWAYRVDTVGGRRFFLKLRLGEFAPGAVLLPGFLRARGVRQAVAPIGGTGHRFGDYRLLLYPFHDGGSLWSRGLTDPQWIEYGAFLRDLHAVTPSAHVASVLPVDTCQPVAGGRLRALAARAGASDTLGSFWRRYGAALLRLAETADELAARVRPAGHVICHADIHPGNMIADGGGPLHVVDWDAPVLAARERDLMFVYSRDFGDHPIDARRAGLFRRGYGPREPDETLLSFYRAERRLDDVASFLDSILDPGASPEARAEDLHWLTRIARAVG
jgi:spectinomycin phosphotransferase